MQVDPIKPMSKAPGTRRLKLKHDELLSSFGFRFNLRHYSKALATWRDNVAQVFATRAAIRKAAMFFGGRQQEAVWAGWRAVVVGRTTPLIHPSYTRDAPLIHPTYTPHVPLMHPSYTSHTLLIHSQYITDSP